MRDGLSTHSRNVSWWYNLNRRTEYDASGIYRHKRHNLPGLWKVKLRRGSCNIIWRKMFQDHLVHGYMNLVRPNFSNSWNLQLWMRVEVGKNIGKASGCLWNI